MMDVFCEMPDVVRKAIEVNDSFPERAKRKLINAWTRDFLRNVNRELWPHSLHLRRSGKGKYVGLRKPDAPGTAKAQAKRIKQIADREFKQFCDHLKRERV